MPIRSLRLLKSGLAMVVPARFIEAADNGAHDGMEASGHLHHAWTVSMLEPRHCMLWDWRSEAL